MELKGKRIKIRPIEKEDLPIVIKWWNDSEVMYYADDNPMPHKTLNQLIEEYEKEKNEWAKYMERFVIETKDGKLIGDILYHSYRSDIKSAIFGIFIGEKDCWGKGYGTEATRLFLKYLFENKGLHKVWLTVSDFNQRAIRCFEKCGFRRDGILRDQAIINGKFINHIVMSILRDKYFEQYAGTSSNDI